MLLTKLSEAENQFIQELSFLARYFEEYDIPLELQNETRKYLEYQYMNT